MIVYVYQNPCKDCASIEQQLELLRKEDENVRVFSFEHGINSSVVYSVIEKYNITDIPSFKEVRAKDAS